MDGFFQYPFRWSQVFEASSIDEQISLLESRDNTLELFIHLGGGCALDLPYRWAQLWPGLLAGEEWAIACAEENDRAIESLFGGCSCCSSTFSFEASGFVGGGFGYATGFTAISALGANAFVSVTYDDLILEVGFDNVTLTIEDLGGEGSILATTVLTPGAASVIFPASVNDSGLTFGPIMQLNGGNSSNIVVRFYGDIIDDHPSWIETDEWVGAT